MAAVLPDNCEASEQSDLQEWSQADSGSSEKSETPDEMVDVQVPGSAPKPQGAQIMDLKSTSPELNLEKSANETKGVSPSKTPASAEANEHKFSPSAEKPQKEEPGSSSTSQFVIVRASDGSSFLLPWNWCNSWQKLQDTLKHVCAKNEDSLKRIDEGNFIMSTMGGNIILPLFWENVLQRIGFGELRINLPLLRPTETNDEAAEDDLNGKEAIQTIYEPKIKYSINYRRRYHHSDNSFFLYASSHDQPVELGTSWKKPATLPVLEQIQEVICPPSYEPIRQENTRKPRKLEPEDKIGDTSLRIHSSLLLNALRAIIEYPSVAPSGDEDSTHDGNFKYPYWDLYHHRNELLEYKKGRYDCRTRHSEDENRECDEHIDMLLEYLYSQSTIRPKEAEASWRKSVPTTNFASFWLLVKPGTDVYVRVDGRLDAYVVDSVQGGVTYSLNGDLATVAPYSILVWGLDFDGRVINRIVYRFEVPVFDDERDITTLPLFPTRFEDKKDDCDHRRKLIERGRKFFKCAQGPAFMEYTGKGLKPGWKEYKRSRVVIDHTECPWNQKAFERLGRFYDFGSHPYGGKPGANVRKPRCECKKCSGNHGDRSVYLPAAYTDYDNISPSNVKELTEHQYLLCAPVMFGFVLKDRSYDLLHVSSLTEARLVENAIDTLVMKPEANKDTIKAIVKTYTEGQGQDKVFNADFIQGKGEGQIILLHGPPGTGKTLTAESVAEYTRRPLVSITAGDLGHEPEDLEKNLLRFFKNANEWNAVVLLDEADVYLERRTTNDLKRNSIVSIFLRALDYFQGILFLTTNRVGHFDEAFMSRIHVSIGYARHDDSTREEIWDNLFTKLQDDQKKGGLEIRYDYYAKQYVMKSDEIKKLQWNGREIRNAFQTAVALAIFDARREDEKCGNKRGETVPEIKEKHLSQVVSMSAAFRDYITSTHEDLGDSKLAFKLGIRNDEFGTTEIQSTRGKANQRKN